MCTHSIAVARSMTPAAQGGVVTHSGTTVVITVKMGYTLAQMLVPLNGKREDFLPCVRLSGSPHGKRAQTLKNKEKFYENNPPPL